ncbi:MAG: hypothetical protein JWQ38_1233 [Flavipsychrobacter sp.]|nr:hypothetical protein [Flavipsychrobacter sp.]
MVLKWRAERFVFILLFLCTGMRTTAQPTLPDIAASADKGIVVISWNCQYSNIKLIAVLRSADSVSNYTTIGNVKNLNKGLQAFVDGHPAAGKNYYKLSIVFKSGLNWRSNHCSISIDRSLLESSLKLPSNDSLQHFTVTEEKTAPNKTAQQNNTGAGNAEQKNTPQNTPTTEVPKHKISVSFDEGVIELPDIKNAIVKDTIKPLLPKHKVVISFGEPEENISVNIKSQYIFADATTGHVNMFLPDDVNKTGYSVKFYNAQNKMIFEVPRIKAPKIIIDKRNFQGKGTYKFVLRKDGLELETGFVTLN